jgi:hypothetical protein
MSASSTTEITRKPCRVRHSHTQSIHAPPGEVFPLLCPIREQDWVPGWRPDWVITDSGFAEAGCVFQTPGSPEGPTPAALWLISDCDPAAGRVGMIKVIPGHTVTRLQIALRPDGEERTNATIAYEYTALGPAGERFVAGCTAEWYRQFMADWETAMNHYLATGEQRPPET